MNNQIIIDINELNEYENISKTIYSAYYEENKLIGLVTNKTILNKINVKSLKYVDNTDFINNIENYVKKYTSFDFKQRIIKNAYQMAIDDGISIDNALKQYYDNIQEEDIIKIAYYTLVSYYIKNDLCLS